jgi:hypothetical protein
MGTCEFKALLELWEHVNLVLLKLLHTEILPVVQDQYQNNEQNRLQDFLVPIIWNET